MNTKNFTAALSALREEILEPTARQEEEYFNLLREVIVRLIDLARSEYQKETLSGFRYTATFHLKNTMAKDAELWNLLDRVGPKFNKSRSLNKDVNFLLKDSGFQIEFEHPQPPSPYRSSSMFILQEVWTIHVWVFAGSIRPTL